MTFSDSENGLFSPEDIQRLMRIEYDRVIRYGISCCLMLIEVDRLGYLQDLYGVESKEKILQGITELLHTVTRDLDPVGCRQEDRILAVFPHATQEEAAAVARRLLEGTRRLEFQSDERSLRVTLSVGVAVAEAGSGLNFDHFLRATEEAVTKAIDGGGDRSVECHPAAEPSPSSAGSPEPPEDTGSGGASAAPGSAAPELQAVLGDEPAETGSAISEGLGKGAWADQIRTLFRRLGPRTPGLDRIESQVIKITEESLATFGADGEAGEEERRQIDILEGRVAKLKLMLDATEDELHSLALEKGVDPGIKSIYRSVQGLATDTDDYARKRDILGLIYEANLRLLEKLRSGA